MDHKVLCIDDESHNLEALERLLRKTYQVITCDSGPSALKELSQHQFSLIISDQKMPEMTGVEFFQKAKKQQPEAVRILLTGYTDLESVINAINQGQIYRYITKPWEPDEFLGIAKQAVEVFEMKKTIALQNNELTKANEQLKSLDKLKTDFMLLVNHELKTPLTGIFSFVQLLSEEKLAPEHLLYVQKIEKNTRRLQGLIDDTLLITRIQADPKNLVEEEKEIMALVHDQWTEMEKLFTNKKLTLQIENNSPFQQTINEKYIRLIIKKLLHNAFSHAPDESTISIELSEQDHQWSLKTKNPLDKEIAENKDLLLSAFSTSGSLLNHAGGTGLGLAVIQSIVNLFQGEIQLSTDNKIFSLSLQFPKGDSNS